MKTDNFINQKIRAVIRYYGGKSHLARRIINLMGDHHTYIEPFAGGLSVLLNKYRSPEEIVSDVNFDLIHMYNYLAQYPSEMIARVRDTPRTKERFLAAKQAGILADPLADPLDRALNFLVRYQMSRGGMGRDFSEVADPEDRGQGWDTLPESLVLTADRLKGVDIRFQDAFQVIPEFNRPDVLLYADPPYYPLSRVAPKVYEHELSSFEHIKLLRLLKTFQGQVILSGYGNYLYDTELKDWQRHEYTAANPSSQQKTKPKVTEVLWVKPAWSF